MKLQLMYVSARVFYSTALPQTCGVTSGKSHFSLAHSVNYRKQSCLTSQGKARKPSPTADTSSEHSLPLQTVRLIKASVLSPNSVFQAEL